MNKYQLACEVSKRTKKSLKDVIPIVNSAIEVMADTIVEDEKFSTSGLGTFILENKKQRTGYNPARQIPIIIPAHKSIKFKPSTSLQNRVNDKYEKAAATEKGNIVAEP